MIMIKLHPFLVVVVLLIALLPVSSLFAQDEQTFEHNNLKLAFEFSSNLAGCKLAEHERIRKDDQRYNALLFSRRYALSTTYFGIKPEYFLLNNRLGIASGLRFTTAKSELIAGTQKFLWKVEEDGLHTSYVKIDELRQKSYLLSVPVEIRYFLSNKEKPFQTYLKIGASLDYRLNSDNQATLLNETMQKYEDLVQHQMSDNDNVFSSFAFAAIGFKIGKFREERRVPWVNFEFTLPYILLTDKSFAFVKGGIRRFPGFGLQLSLQFPIGHNVPIGSN